MVTGLAHPRDGVGEVGGSARLETSGLSWVEASGQGHRVSRRLAQSLASLGSVPSLLNLRR